MGVRTTVGRRELGGEIGTVLVSAGPHRAGERRAALGWEQAGSHEESRLKHSQFKMLPGLTYILTRKK